jgi:hypothetical protein
MGHEMAVEDPNFVRHSDQLPFTVFTRSVSFSFTLAHHTSVIMVAKVKKKRN